MTRAHCLAATLAVSSILLAACHMGAGGMDMPPPTSGPTPTSSGTPSQVDPNLHVTMPAQSAGAMSAMPPQGAMDGGANAGMAGMPGMAGSGARTGAGATGAMDAGSAMPGMGKHVAMDAGPPMGGAMQDGGMKKGCCGDAPMPMPSPQPSPPTPSAPMPMKPHGDGHM